MPLAAKIGLAVVVLTCFAVLGALLSRKWTRARPPLKRSAARAAEEAKKL